MQMLPTYLLALDFNRTTICSYLILTILITFIYTGKQYQKIKTKGHKYTKMSQRISTIKCIKQYFNYLTLTSIVILIQENNI